MATIDDVEINGNPLGFSNEDEARIELLKTDADVKLHVLDEQGLQELKDEAIQSIGGIEAGLNKKVDDVKAELEAAYGSGDTETLEKAKEHTDNRLQALQQTLTTKEEQLKETMEELIEEVDNLGNGIDNKIDGKVDVLKNELEPKIEANKTLSETNKTTIETVKQFIDFQIQGTLRLVGILTETSSEVDKEQDKDTWLTEKVKESGKIKEMVSGYFVRCSDEVCYFYVDGTWHKGTSGRQSFLVSKPLEFNGRSIELKLKSGSGLKVDTDGTLTFDLTDTTNFDKFLKNDVDATINSVYTFQQAVKCEVDAADDKDLVRLSQVNTLIDTAVKGIQHVSYTGSDAIEIDGTTNAISLKVDANSALKVTTDGLTIDLSNVSGNVDLTPYPKKNESNEITAEWDFKAGLKTDVDATDEKHVVNLKKVNEIVDAKFATVPAQVVYTAGDGITIDNNNSITLKVKPNAGLKLDTDGVGLDNDALALAFTEYAKKNEVTVITEGWTFNKPITLKEQATNDDHVPTWSQVKTHVATEIANVGQGNTPQPQPIVYTGKAPIKVENTEISLVLKTNGGLKEDNGELALDLDNVDLTGKVDLTGYTKASQDESITGNWTYTILPKSDVEATEEHHFTNLKTVNAKIKEEIDKVNQVIPQPIKYSGVDAIVVDDAQNQISLKIVTDGGLKQDANGLTIDMDKLDIAGKVDLTDYTKSNENETIEEEWVFNQPPKSLQEANDEKHLVNLKQVQDMIAGIKVTGGEYTGTGAIHIDTNKEISLKVDTNSGLKIDNNMLTIDRANNNNVDLTPYPTKAGNETISGEWKFTSVPKITTKATENEHIPNFQQVKEEITNSMVNGIPEVDKIVEEAKTEVEKVVNDGKGEITKLSGEQMNALNAIITNGTQLLTSGKEEIEKISKEKLEAINTAFEDQKAGIDEKLHEGDKYFQNLLADSADKLDEYSTKTKEEVKRVVELANERMLLESQARQAEISELAEEKLKEFRKLPNPTEKEMITFKTLNIDASGEGNIVGFQKIVTDLTGQILRYGDMMVLGGNFDNYRADPNSKRASRLNFPTNDIEFDRWTFNFGSFAAIPKRGQTVNLKTIGYEDKEDIDVDLDYYVFFLGHNGGGQFGTSDKEHRRKAVPIKFEDVVKSVMIQDWNQGGNSDTVMSYVLLENGKLFASGRNDSGQFGLGNTAWHTTFTLIKENVEEIVGEIYGSVTYVKDKEGCYWKAGTKGWDFNEDEGAWRKISEKNASKLHYFSDWNGHRGFATELWFDNDKKMWVGRGNNDYYQRDETKGTLKKDEIGNYLTLNRIRDDLVEVFNFPLSMYAFSKTTAYSWGRYSTPLSSEWTSGNSATAHETPMPLPGRDFKLIPIRQGVTTSDYKTIIVLYYPDLHRLFLAGNIIGSFGLIYNKAYQTWTEIDLPPKVNPDSDVEIRYFYWNTNYQLAIIMENGLYLAGVNAGTRGDYFSPKSSLFNKQEW